MNQQKAPVNHVFYRNQNWRYPRIVRGEGIYLYGEDGKVYLDGCSGSAVANIGHGNQEVAECARRQTEQIAFTHLSRWTVDVIENCASRIAAWCPGDLNHVYFVSGGSEATETAIKMARQYFVERDGPNSKKWKVISKWHSYHGATLGSLSLSGTQDRRLPYGPLLTDFPKINQFYHYRNPWGTDDPEETSRLAAQELKQEILRQGPENVSAFITEAVVGSAVPGCHPEPIYFERVKEICAEFDILLIVDEVMSGAGRTGKKMAIDHYGIQPDIIALAKGLSSGYTPLGAAVCSGRIFDTIMVQGSGHFVHGHTYAGNPLSCAIGDKVLEITEREGCVDNAATEGAYILAALEELTEIPMVGDVRGKGLLLGIEFVKDAHTREPFPKAAKVAHKVTEACLQAGVVLYPGGGSADNGLGDHVLIAPPLTIAREQTKDLVRMIRAGIEKVAKGI